VEDYALIPKNSAGARGIVPGNSETKQPKAKFRPNVRPVSKTVNASVIPVPSFDVLCDIKPTRVVSNVA